MNDLLPVTTGEKIAEVKREIDMRYRVYGLNKSARQQRQIDIMQAILDDYEAQLKK